ncbi:transglutaminase domain-containing protein [Paraliobacillus salinarum]|uniref:transglutaminase domain-containing protein n=1 Tax=Paraliobacillus salinarum TaxID=1158996 RepID=UPI0015F4AD37|nr:transglutaminase domain-containing protein [Paraliobacillus salinarum]
MTSLHQKDTKVFHALLYLGGFLLFMEWLRPLAIISDTGNVEIFILFAGFCFLLSLIRLTRWIAIPLKFAAVLIILDGLFLQGRIGSQGWLHSFSTQLDYNLGLIQNQVWTDFTPFFRTLLFLIILWLMSFLLHYWFVVARRVFLFVLFTFIYITVLDTFTTYQADSAIIRTVIISLFVFAIASFLNQMDRERLRPAFGKWFASSLIPIVILSSIFIAVGFTAPKFNPIWPDPVPYLTSTAENAGMIEGSDKTVQKVGYGIDDSKLGGSFIQDDTPVFMAESERRHYYRIESKNQYTGKGWERSTNLEFEEQSNGSIDLDLFSSEVKTERLEASITFTEQANFNKLVYPYGLDAITGQEQLELLLEKETGTIEIEGKQTASLLGEYQVAYRYPSFSLEQLSQDNFIDPMDIKAQYLQLPANLPDRVVALAEEITKDATNRYDRSKAIEDYFDNGNYTYQTTDVAIPEGDEDYVDQFLFDTQVGYCDNFSTSMVVMLRALDIPARWAKGFTGGQLTDQSQAFEKEKNTYEITNGNAHSWVEVYFPTVGWVPFEPTIGFTGGADVYQENEGEASETETDEEVDEEEQQQENQQQQEEEQEDTNADVGANNNSNFNVPWYVWLIIVSIIVVLGVMLYVYRYRWLNRLMLYRYPTFDNVQAFERAYHYLLRVLHHQGIKQHSGETLREYAVRVDQQFNLNKMSELTAMYEKILYRNELSLDQDKYAHQLWKDMLTLLL